MLNECRRLRLLVIAGAITLLSPFCIAHAQSPGFTVSPVKTFISKTRGEVYSGNFEIVNRSSAPLPLQATSEFFGVKDEFGTIAFGVDKNLASAENPNSWVALEQPFLLLGPRETRSVPLTIRIPEGSPFGTYALAVTFNSKFPNSGAGTSAAQLLPAIGSLFFIDVMPRPGEELPARGRIDVKDLYIEEKDKIQIKPFGASAINSALSGMSLEFVEKSPLEFRIRLENTGRFLVQPSGTLEIRDVFGHSIGSAVLPDGAIFPGAVRSYSVKVGKSSVTGILKYLPEFIRSSFLPGRYTAMLTFAKDKNAEVPEPYVISFWAFPRKFILSTILPLTIMAIFVVLYRRRIILAVKAFIWQKQ